MLDFLFEFLFDLFGEIVAEGLAALAKLLIPKHRLSPRAYKIAERISVAFGAILCLGIFFGIMLLVCSSPEEKAFAIGVWMLSISLGLMTLLIVLSLVALIVRHKKRRRRK